MGLGAGWEVPDIMRNSSVEGWPSSQEVPLGRSSYALTGTEPRKAAKGMTVLGIRIKAVWGGEEDKGELWCHHLPAVQPQIPSFLIRMVLVILGPNPIYRRLKLANRWECFSEHTTNEG